MRNREKQKEKMTTEEAQEKAKVVSSIIKVVGDTIKEAGAIPSGHLYSVLAQFGFNIQQYEKLIDAFTAAGKVKEVGGLIYWIENKR